LTDFWRSGTNPVEKIRIASACHFAAIDSLSQRHMIGPDTDKTFIHMNSAGEIEAT